MKTYFKCKDEHFPMEFISNKRFHLSKGDIVYYKDIDYVVSTKYLDLEREMFVVELIVY